MGIGGGIPGWPVFWGLRVGALAVLAEWLAFIVRALWNDDPRSG